MNMAADRSQGEKSETTEDKTMHSDIAEAQKLAADIPRSTDVTSNSPAKERQPAEHLELDKEEHRSPSTSKPKGTEAEGTDDGPGGTGW